jgi:hypothetical protein
MSLQSERLPLRRSIRRSKESRHCPDLQRSARMESRASWRFMQYRVKFIEPPRVHKASLL